MSNSKYSRLGKTYPGARRKSSRRDRRLPSGPRPKSAGPLATLIINTSDSEDSAPTQTLAQQISNLFVPGTASSRNLHDASSQNREIEAPSENAPVNQVQEERGRLREVSYGRNSSIQSSHSLRCAEQALEHEARMAEIQEEAQKLSASTTHLSSPPTEQKASSGDSGSLYYTSSSTSTTSVASRRPLIIAGVLLFFVAFLPTLYVALFGSLFSATNYIRSLPRSKKILMHEKLFADMIAPASVSFSSNFTTAVAAGVAPYPFSGIVYAPREANEPDCGFSKEDALCDIALLSTLTTRLRLYGTQCKLVEHTLYAIKTLGVNMTVAMGIWLSNQPSVNEKQIHAAESILLSADSKYIDSIFVGNEVLLRDDMSSASLVRYIQSLRNMTAAMSLSIPVGTADIPSALTNEVIMACDVVGLNLQPFLAGIPSSDAAVWVSNELSKFSERASNTSTQILITEVGWPYNGGKFKDAIASPSDFQEFMTTWLKYRSHRIDAVWYYFEAFNEPWKQVYDKSCGSWEKEWGIFDHSRRLKLGIEIPTPHK